MHTLATPLAVYIAVALGVAYFQHQSAVRPPSRTIILQAVAWPAVFLGMVAALTAAFLLFFGSRLGIFSRKALEKFEDLNRRYVDAVAETTEDLGCWVRGCSPATGRYAAEMIPKMFNGIRAEYSEETGRVTWTEHPVKPMNRVIAGYVIGVQDAAHGYGEWLIAQHPVEIVWPDPPPPPVE